MKGGEFIKEVGKGVASAFAGIFTTFFHLYGAILGLVGVAIVFDTITGIIGAKASGFEVTSKKANRGFWKKVALLLALLFGIFLDMFIPEALSVVNVALPFNMPFGLIFGCYIVFNEAISVCENLYKINPEILPKWVKGMLQGSLNKIDTMAINKEDE